MTEPERDARTRALVLACGLGAVAVAGVAILIVLALGGAEADRPAVETPRTPAGNATPSRPPAETTRLFARTSFWNKRLGPGTALDPSSAVLVQALVAEVNRELQAGIGPWIATVQASTPLYRVGPDQRRVRVRLDAEGIPGGNALRRAFAAVPIPSNARPASGPDRHMTVWQPSSDTLWEFFKARRRADGWHARWGGAIRRVSASRGYYTSAAWPGATSNWGATASSLPVIGGTILRSELSRGRIDHALAVNLPFPRAGTFAWPAQRTDGMGPATALPEGARLRLDPSLDLSLLGLSRPARIIASAAQRYGLVVRDQTSQAISLFAEDPTPHGTNPYRELFARKPPSELLAQFPWDDLEVIRMHLCRTAPCRER
jgi:hypothetical protein